MKRARWLVVLAVMAMIAAACGGGGGTAEKAKVNVFGAFSGTEAQAVQSVIDDKINNADKDYEATYEGSDSFEEQIKIRVEGGNPPDIALYPQPGAVIEQAKAGNAIALEDLGFDMAALEATFGKYLLSLGEYNGKHYGLPTNTNLKSLVWYTEPAFTDAGYTVPKTWDEMIALSDKMVADGNTPWCIGFGSEAATGWPGTDWIEDIMLRTAGADMYDQWVNHQLLFESPEVKRAFELLGDVTFTPGYVLGGADQIPAIDFRDAPDPMFNTPPSCFMHRQASFITQFFDAQDGRTLVAGTDYGVFAFPDIDPGKKGALIAGELGAVFNDRPEVREFLNDFISTDIQCAQGGTDAGRISPNVNVGPDCYKDSITATAAGAIVDALKIEGARFDASDLMPSVVGAGSFWTGMVDYMQGGPSSLDTVLKDIDDSWPSS
ncbi:MAG: extracellular solute-binding protein [Gammaproteobacteria bacterium]|nr:extracellular solute-binding protein [Gammaproteobacteria bacterium]